MALEFPDPDLQVAFAVRLEQIEHQYLQGALARAITSVGVATVDAELQTYVPTDQLTDLARFGLRGELVFPCPSLLAAQPTLVGYYRLLYGYSQKEFYAGRSGRQKFKPMEDVGQRGRVSDEDLAAFCTAAAKAGLVLVASVPVMSLERVRDLQLLTLGTQLRGSRLNQLGAAARDLVFGRIQAAIAPDAMMDVSPTAIRLRNSPGRTVRVEFSSDPDIAIIEELSTGESRRLAIEIKGGTDYSNIHNRLGEAEKSHIKAKADGFAEFWTILNVGIPDRDARRDSPTTNQFFRLSSILDPTDPEWTRFRDELTSRLSVPATE